MRHPSKIHQFCSLLLRSIPRGRHNARIAVKRWRKCGEKNGIFDDGSATRHLRHMSRARVTCRKVNELIRYRNPRSAWYRMTSRIINLNELFYPRDIDSYYFT
ncbi:hypothetical protein ALC60_12512 [Trachymyrmex zeteki]|uniref:Uncharacterized protein n=1 Tax=Mycetomoellerius zeteki TaxID=64791 RepID=A0A151WKT8_9HYME|nr:hypothetical protein ALC60_12512 [Trachymyrmex zeteki]